MGPQGIKFRFEIEYRLTNMLRALFSTFPTACQRFSFYSLHQFHFFYFTLNGCFSSLIVYIFRSTSVQSINYSGVIIAMYAFTYRLRFFENPRVDAEITVIFLFFKKFFFLVL